MAAHPNQATTSIRLYRGLTEIADYARLPEGSRNWANNAEVVVTVTKRGASKGVSQRYSCQGEADQWKCSPSSDDCTSDTLEIDLRRDLANGVILANPNSSLPLVKLCSSDVKAATKSDDKIFRLSPMPLSACGI